MANITQDKLWRLWELIQKSRDEYSHAFELQQSGRIALLNVAGDGPEFDTVDGAIDFLDPPKPPTSEEWHDKWCDLLATSWPGQPTLEQRKAICALNKLAERRNRAKAAQRDERSMFNLRGEE